MKTYNILKTFFIVALLINLVSCSNDITPTPNGYGVVTGSTPMDLQSGTIVDHGNVSILTDSTSTTSPTILIYSMVTNFLSNGVTFDPSTNQLTGAGHRLSIQFNSPEDHHIAPGTYVFSNRTDIFTFKGGFIQDSDDFTQTSQLRNITSGTIRVNTQDEVNYDIIFDCVLNTGDTVIGTYNGLVMVYSDKVNN